MQILGPHSYLGRICIEQWMVGIATQAGKAMARLILWPGASAFNNLICSKVGQQPFQETRNPCFGLQTLASELTVIMPSLTISLR